MIRTVADLRRALDAYPDDTEVIIFGYPFAEFRPIDLYTNMDTNMDERLVVDAFDHRDPATVARLCKTVASLKTLGPDEFVNLSAMTREEQRKAMFGDDDD